MPLCGAPRGRDTPPGCKPGTPQLSRRSIRIARKALDSWGGPQPTPQPSLSFSWAPSLPPESLALCPCFRGLLATFGCPPPCKIHAPWVQARDPSSPMGPMQKLPGRHRPLVDNPSLLLGLITFFPGLPRHPTESLASGPCSLVAFLHFRVTLVRETHTLGAIKGTHEPLGHHAVAGGKALASRGQTQPPCRPSRFFSLGCSNILLKDWHTVPVSRGPSCCFDMPPW